MGDQQVDENMRSFVRIPEKDWDRLVSIERNCSVIGRFGRDRPSMECIRAEIRSSLRIEGERIVYGYVPRYCSVCSCLGHDVSNCRRKRNGDELDNSVEGNGEGEQAGSLAMAEIHHENGSTPPDCGNVPMRSNDLIAKGTEQVQREEQFETANDAQEAILEGNELMPTTPINLEAGAVEQGLEALVRKGIDVDQFVAEAVLEAAVNIIENAAENVMEEEVRAEECDVNGKAKKGEEVGNEKEKQGDSSSKDGGSKDESTQSVSYGTWAENLKKKAGEDSDLIKVIEEAKQEVGYFFQLAFKELGKEIYDECSDEIVKKANEFFILKLEREGKKIGSRLKRELGWIEKDTPAAKRNENGESDESSNASSKRKGRVIKNSMDWVDIVKEFMEKDNEFERKVKEALKAVNDYLWTVFDKEKNAYLEDGKARAVRGAAIFLEIVKQCSTWGAENGLLGRILKPNQELIGGQLCIWAEELNL
nr:hypothetical protein Iba_chr01dCG15950 [Ipomoea batatas]